MADIVSKPANTFSIKKVHVYIFFAAVCLLFAGSIIATYFGKSGTVYLVIFFAHFKSKLGEPITGNECELKFYIPYARAL